MAEVTSQPETDSAVFRVLIADDDYDFGIRPVKRQVENTLAFYGICPHEIFIATSAQLAYDLVTTIHFDLILMDKTMPPNKGDSLLDGYMAAAAIHQLTSRSSDSTSNTSGSLEMAPRCKDRRESDSSSQVPKKAFIASISSECLSEPDFPLGISAYIGKPVDIAVLRLTIKKLVSRQK